MSRFVQTILFSVALAASSLAHADTVTKTNGSDLFVAGKTISETLGAERDVFIAGRAVTAKGTGRGDTHISGFDLNIEADSAADLYAVGMSVAIRGTVGEDLTAAGYTLRTAQTAVTDGNARLLGGSIIIDGPVKGDLSVGASEVVLNAAVGGDAMIAAKTITFGAKAKIAGKLEYAAPETIQIPERVILPANVAYEKFTDSDRIESFRESWDDIDYPVLPTFMSIFAAFLMTLGFFVIIGAIFLTFLPKPVEAMRRSVVARPGQIFLVGVIGLSILFGMGPITALTIIGLPLLPIVLLATILAWTLGYMLGAYAIALRLLEGFWGEQDASKPMRLVAFAAVICAIALLNFIPFVGWVANYTLVLLGIGAMTNALFERMIGNAGPALDVDMNPIED